MPKKLVLTALVVVAVVGVGGFFVVRHSRQSQPSTNRPNPEEKQASQLDADKKQALVEDNKSVNDTNTQPKTTSLDLGAEQTSSESVTVFTKLYGVSSGSCNLSVTNSNQSSTQTAAVVYQPEYSSCTGFSIPTDKLGTGSWNIVLTVTTNGQQFNKSIVFTVK